MTVMKKKCKKIIGYVSSAIMIVVLVFTVIFVLSSRSGEPARLFGYSLSYVPTNSMEEVIHQDSVILIKKDTEANYDVGDIIVYRAISGAVKGKLVVHRIIEITDEGYITQGDNNPIPDSDTVTYDMLYGEYIGNVEFLNFIGKISINKNIIFILIMIMVAVLIISQGLSLYLAYKKNNEKMQEEIMKKELLEKIRHEMYEEEIDKINQNAEKVN